MRQMELRPQHGGTCERGLRVSGGGSCSSLAIRCPGFVLKPMLEDETSQGSGETPSPAQHWFQFPWYSYVSC